MITAIISLGELHGAELWLAGWLACVIAYFAILLPLKVNRGKAKNVLFWFLAAEVLTDLVWALLCYAEPVFLDYGIVVAWGLIPWLIILGAAGLIACIQNKK